MLLSRKKVISYKKRLRNKVEDAGKIVIKKNIEKKRGLEVEEDEEP